jgi:uncharacterized membrane protein
LKLEIPTLRRAFLTGMLVLAPIVVTGWVFVSLFRFIDGRARPLLQNIPWLNLPEEGFTGVGFVAAIVLVTLVGLLANNLIGRWLLGWLERLFDRIPWIKAVYRASKDIASVVFGERGRAFRKVVLLEYPRRGIYSVGFVTREEETEDVVHVFLPTTPNPTSGYLLMVPRKDAIPLPIPIEDGLKLVISGGAVIAGDKQRLLETALARIRSE